MDQIPDMTLEWLPVHDRDRHHIGARAWVPEAGGWVQVFYADWMRRDQISAAIFVPSLTAWRSGTLNAPIALTLDFGHATHVFQSAPKKE